VKHIITPFIFYTRTIIKGKRSGVKKWRWVIYIEENMKKGVNCLNCRKYKNNVDNLNPAMVY